MRTLRMMLATVVGLFATAALAQTQLTIATVNNADMIIMQKLSPQLEAAHPDIKLNWVVLEENVLRAARHHRHRHQGRPVRHHHHRLLRGADLGQAGLAHAASTISATTTTTTT